MVDEDFKMGLSNGWPHDFCSIVCWSRLHYRRGSWTPKTTSAVPAAHKVVYWKSDDESIISINHSKYSSDKVRSRFVRAAVLFSPFFLKSERRRCYLARSTLCLEACWREEFRQTRQTRLNEALPRLPLEARLPTARVHLNSAAVPLFSQSWDQSTRGGKS